MTEDHVAELMRQVRITSGFNEMVVNEYKQAIEKEILAKFPEFAAAELSTNSGVAVDKQRSDHPAEDDVFRVYLNAGLELGRGAKRHAPDKMLGHDHSWVRYSVFHASGHGCAIVDEASGFEVAELIKNDLIIFFDTSVAIFTEILKRAAALIQIRNETNRVASGYAVEGNDKELFVFLCMDGLRYATMVARAEQKVQEKLAQQAKKDCAQHIAEIKEAETKAVAIGVDSEERRAKCRAEFDQLCALPRILRVTAENGAVQVFTDTLYCHVLRSSKCYELGKFRFEIKPGSLPKCFNLTRTVTISLVAYYAPNVGADDRLLSPPASLKKCVEDCQVSKLVEETIQFLETASDKWKEYMEKWPVVEKTDKAAGALSSSTPN